LHRARLPVIAKQNNAILAISDYAISNKSKTLLFPHPEDNDMMFELPSKSE